MNKICYKCKQTKEIKYFPKNCQSKDGFNNRCKDCINFIRRNNKSQKIKDVIKAQQNRKLRQDYINQYKSNGCSLCGYKKCLEALTFHHINKKDKLDTISNMACKSRSFSMILSEIKKCIVLCQNCHHELHVNKRDIGKNNRFDKEN